MAKKLNLNELRSMLGVAEITIKTWRHQELPGSISNRKLLFNPVDVYRWLLSKGKAELAARMENRYPGISQASSKAPLNRTVAESQNKKPATPGKSTKGIQIKPPRKPRLGTIPNFATVEESQNKKPATDQPNAELIKQSMNIFEVKTNVGMFLERIKVLANRGDDASLVILLKEFGQLGDLMRKLEMDCIDIDKRLGSIIEISEARRIIATQLVKVKTELRSIPASLADRLASMGDPKEINLILGAKIDEALRHVSDELMAVKQDTDQEI